MFRWLKRKRFTVTLMGLESGIKSVPVSFVCFRKREQAQKWCDEMNTRERSVRLTKWEVFEL